ncbi:nicotinate-nucleotide adenylyltransferase [Chloroflexota bacterium]
MAAVIRRLGILGGTFDPIHDGHLVAAEETRYQLDLDRVLFVPAGVPPHKPDRPISPAHHRLRMIELAIAGRPHFAISRVDVDRPGPCYTVDTLQLLRTEWGRSIAFFFVAGADSLNEFATWYQPQRVIELSELAVVGRPGVELDRAQLERQLPGLSSRIHWIQMPLLEISSSALRARVRAGRSISYLVPEAVEAYVLDHGLYLESKGD